MSIAPLVSDTGEIVSDRVSRQRPDVPENGLREVLMQLGDTEAQVVRTLFEEDCRGPRQNDCFCPVAQYVAKHTGKAASVTSHVTVTGEFTYDPDDGHIDTFIGREWTKTPPVVGAVVESIDRGRYPELNQPGRNLYGETSVD